MSRIEELRALRKAEDDAFVAWKTATNKRQAYRDYISAQDKMIEATGASIDALLDCAEALAVVTAALEWQAHGRCRTGYYDGPILPAAEAVERGVAALAKLEGRE